MADEQNNNPGARQQPLAPRPGDLVIQVKVAGDQSCIVQSKIRGHIGNGKRPITAAEYGTLQHAYDHFDTVLFDGSLPQVLITLQHHRRALGYFSAKRFQRRGNTHGQIHELALNPDGFTGQPDETILSVLVHEMAHVWQQEYGKPGRGRYHNREWGRKMHSIGLMPSSTGQPGGATTGDHMSHYILEDGLFTVACRSFLERYHLTWESATPLVEDGASVTDGNNAKTQTRSKYTCPNAKCGLNMWGKPGALIDCHTCSLEAGEPVLMQEQWGTSDVL